MENSTYLFGGHEDGGVDVATDKYKTEFKARLRHARIEAGFKTARRFSQALGIDEARYRKYEREDDQSILPGYEVLIQISLITGRSLQWLLTGEGK